MPSRGRRSWRPPPTPRNPLPTAVEMRLRMLIAAGATRDQAAATVGISRSLLDTRLRDQMRDLRVGRGRQRIGRRRGPGGRLLDDFPELSPEEIAERCAAVRALWTEAERRERMLNFSGPLPDV